MNHYYYYYGIVIVCLVLILYKVYTCCFCNKTEEYYEPAQYPFKELSTDTKTQMTTEKDTNKKANVPETLTNNTTEKKVKFECTQMM